MKGEGVGFDIYIYIFDNYFSLTFQRQKQYIAVKYGDKILPAAVSIIRFMLNLNWISFTCSGGEHDGGKSW